MLVGGRELRMNSIIELCVLPDMKVHDIMVEMGKQVENPVFLDTVGNLRFKTNALYVLSYRGFVKELLSLRSKKGFVLFVDSISFPVDKLAVNMQKIFNLLWTLIYDNDATIVVSNHYKVVNSSGFASFVPRLGSRWKMMVSYRVMFKYLDGRLCIDVVSDELSADSVFKTRHYQT